MPQPKGFEPRTFIWVLQVRKSNFTSGVFNYDQLAVYIFVTEGGYTDFKAWLPTQKPGTKFSGFVLGIAADYGRQNWFNDKVWMQQQFSDFAINGNFIPNLQP